jgi:hypothetical protein
MGEKQNVAALTFVILQFLAVLVGVAVTDFSRVIFQF